jgi:hypothetical protein
MSNARTSTAYSSAPGAAGNAGISAKSTRAPVVATKDLVPFCGTFCCMNSCVCSTPACYGCYAKEGCCCFTNEFICCKETLEPGFDFICYRGECIRHEHIACCQVPFVVLSILLLIRCLFNFYFLLRLVCAIYSLNTRCSVVTSDVPPRLLLSNLASAQFCFSL